MIELALFGLAGFMAGTMVSALFARIVLQWTATALALEHARRERELDERLESIDAK